MKWLRVFFKRAMHGIGGRSGAAIPLAVSLLFCFFAATAVHANGQDLDAYKWRITALWWFSKPSGFFNSQGNAGSFDLSRDLGFGSYSTFTGGLDWRFKRKHHLTFYASPVESTNSATITRTITFQGQTYNIGTRLSADLRALSFAPGYQWDFFRRNHGYIALVAQVNLMDTKATLTGQAAVNGQVATRSSSGSVFAPLPVFGPRVRWYPLHDSGRLVIDGFVKGMYFFGYGNFISAGGTVGIGLNRNWRLTAGYQMGSRLSIHGSSNQIGLRLTQQGPVAGVEASW